MRNPLKGSSRIYLKHGIILKILPQKCSRFFSNSSCCSPLHSVNAFQGILSAISWSSWAHGRWITQISTLASHSSTLPTSKSREDNFINPKKGNLFDSSKTLQQHTNTVKQPLKGSNFYRPWGSTIGQLSFSCDKNRKQLLLEALKRPRRRCRRNSVSEREPFHVFFFAFFVCFPTFHPARQATLGRHHCDLTDTVVCCKSKN